MTLINKIIRVLPKKQVDVEELKRSLPPPKKLTQAETFVKNSQTLEKEAIDKEFTREVDDNSECEYEIVEREILPEKIVCPDCGGITLEGLEFCDKCGGELTSR